MLLHAHRLPAACATPADQASATAWTRSGSHQAGQITVERSTWWLKRVPLLRPTWGCAIVLPRVWVAVAFEVGVVAGDGPLAPVDVLPMVVHIIPAPPGRNQGKLGRAAYFTWWSTLIPAPRACGLLRAGRQTGRQGRLAGLPWCTQPAQPCMRAGVCGLPGSSACLIARTCTGSTCPGHRARRHNGG